MNDTVDCLFVMVWPDEIERVRSDGFPLDDSSSRILVNKPLYAAGLAKMIGGIRMNGFSEIEVEGRVMHAPSFDRFKKVNVVTIDVSKLDPGMLENSSKMFDSPFFPGDIQGYVYQLPIPPEAILGDEEVALDSPDVPMAP
jgi:hypothetical protein